MGTVDRRIQDARDTFSTIQMYIIADSSTELLEQEKRGQQELLKWLDVQEKIYR